MSVIKRILLALFTVLTIICFAACDNKTAGKYFIDSDGNLTVEYKDGTAESLGVFTDLIDKNSLSFEINKDGFYVINGVVTDIQAKQIKEYYIVDGNLIAEYNDLTKENLGNFKNEAVKAIDSIDISDDGFYVLNGTKTKIVATEIYTVTFKTGFSERVKSQSIRDGYKVERPILEREGYTLDGWYCNGEEWKFNSDVVKGNTELNAAWTANEYTVAFDTGTAEIQSPITVTYDNNFDLPKLTRKGYVFDGWCYKGKLLTESKWKLANDCTLIAKWTINKYTVTFNAKGGNVSDESAQIEYGKSFSLPVATNSYGVFIGWFYNDTQITDEKGKSLSEWLYEDDIEVTTSWVINLATFDDLGQLEKYPNGHFKLLNDIDISSVEWTPVGTDKKPFTGQIDGNNFTIKGLTISQLQSGQKYYGFIGYAQSGKIFDISFSNILIELPMISNTVYVGGVIGKNKNAELNNVSTSGKISIADHSNSYTSYVGGLVGFSGSDDIIFCTNRSDVTTKTIAGGIIGYKDVTAEEDHFYNNKNEGNISAQIAGGIVGDCLFGIAKNCYNIGSVSGKKYAGGIIGRSYAMCYIDNCYNTANISVNGDSPSQFDAAGGIVGSVEYYSTDTIIYVEIKNSYNKGNIESNKNGGGIIGSTNSSINPVEVVNCYNSGNIKGVDYVGGIGGLLYSIKITQSANFGELTQGSTKATLCYSFTYLTTIVDCYYNCSVRGITSVQGTKTNEKFSEAFYKGQLFWSSEIWDFSTTDYPTLKIN